MRVNRSRRARARRQYSGKPAIHRNLKGRTNVLYGLVFVSLTSLILRLGYLQINKGNFFAAEAKTRAIATIPMIPARGRIYDTNGNLLAYDQPILSLYYTQVQNVNTSPAAIQNLSQVLAPQFGTTPAKLENLIESNLKYSTFQLFQNITDKQLAFVGEHQSELPGITVETDGQRTYPYGDLAGQVLGYVGQIPPKLENYYVNQKHYMLNQTIGITGLEMEYEKYLHGQVGEQIEQVDTAQGVTASPIYTKSPVPGDNIQLTLDAKLQADAQNAVEQAIAQYASQNHIQITEGAAVMIDVKTGGVLAMVSYPYFDPNWFITGAFQKHVHYLQTSGAEENNVIQNPHYPGSTVKPANMLTGLESGVITPNTVFDDVPGPMYIGTYGIKEDASYGLVNDIRAIAVSDDKFFYTLGLNLGKWLGSSSYSGGGPLGGNLQKWRDTSFIEGIVKLDLGEMRFGLGALTGIDLPWEQAGDFYISDMSKKTSPAVQIKPQDIKAALDKNGSYPNYGSPVDLVFTAFGQMQQFTPMELAQYVSTIADGGKRLQPHLLKDVMPPGMYSNLQNDSQKPVLTFGTKVEANLKLKPQYLNLVQQGMYAACNEPDGTAYGSFGNAPYKAAGKTGTAEIVMSGKSINNSVFIGYAPFNDPQIAVAVMVPGAGYGATTAVPIARAMMDDYFKEHHASYFPASQWQSSTVPASWLKSPAYLDPEKSK